MEQAKVQNQLEVMSAKLNEISNGKEPIVAFRATSVKDSGGSSEQYVLKKPGNAISNETNFENV